MEQEVAMLKPFLTHRRSNQLLLAGDGAHAEFSVKWLDAFTATVKRC